MLVGWSLAPWCDASDKRPLTVVDMVEARRLLTGANGDAAFPSPDGTHYVIAVIRGDAARNGNWMELQLGRLDSLEGAARLESLATLFTSSLGAPQRLDGLESLTLPVFNSIRWLDANRFTLFWEADGTRQVFLADIRTSKVVPITSHPSNVLTYAVSPQGEVVYAASVEYSDDASQRLAREGFVVTNPDALSLLSGDLDGTGLLDRSWNSEWFLADGRGPPRRIRMGINLSRPFQARFAPNGHYAIVAGTPQSIPQSWKAYLTSAEPQFAGQIEEAFNVSPTAFAARQIAQLYVIDVRDHSAKPLWNAPNPSIVHENFAWSPDSRSVLIAAAYLPPEKLDAKVKAGNAVAVVDVETGVFAQLPVPASVDTSEIGAEGLVWVTGDTIEVHAPAQTFRFRKQGGGWKPIAASNVRSHAPTISIGLRQSLNSPPVLYAKDMKSGREREILDVNPQMRTQFALGRVERFEWVDETHRKWSGILHYPVGYTPTKRFPLVMTTQGSASSTEFSLSGLRGTQPGVGASTSVYSAQVLAGRNIAVLDVEDRFLPGITMSPQEPEAHLAAYESAVAALDARGLIDPAKVGLIGFSRSGWYVQYALVNSAIPFAAALTSDNMDAGYFQATLMPGFFVHENGSRPFGDGLRDWMKRAPPFGADQVRSPLRMQIETGPLQMVLASWEMFSRLRQLGKPVELYVIPDVERGTHNLQNPAQCIAVKQGAVDWFDFWLNGREDPAREKVAQYERWRKLRELHTTPPP